MSLAFRAVATLTPSNNTSHLFPKPAGVVDGDFMLLELVVVSSATPNSVPSGWTVFADFITNPGSNSIYVYTKTAGGSEPTDYTFGFAASQIAGGGIIAYSSDITAAIVVDAHDKLTTSASTNRVWPSVTTSVANTVLIMFCTLENSSGTTPPGSAAERWDASALARIYCMTEAVVAAGATGTRTGTGTSSDAYAITIAIAESLGAVIVAESVTVGESVTVTRLSAAGLDVSVSDSVTVTTTPAFFSATLSVQASQAVTVTATPALLVAPTRPTALAASALTASQIDLTWSHDGLRTDGYSIERSLSALSGFVEIGTTASLSYSDTGLTQNTTYYYKVRAFKT